MCGEWRPNAEAEPLHLSIHPSVSTASIETKHLLQPLWEAARSVVLKKFKSSLISFSLPLQTENEGERDFRNCQECRAMGICYENHFLARAH